MYMGVILEQLIEHLIEQSAPHVYGGDPKNTGKAHFNPVVLPMYMGVILDANKVEVSIESAPHVYGGDSVLAIGLRCC